MTSDGKTGQAGEAQGASDERRIEDAEPEALRQSMHDRRTEALLHVRKALELAEDLKLVSLNIAVAAAQTKSEDWDVRKLKTELADLTNQAVKASKDTSALIEAISGATESDEHDKSSKSPARDSNEFRRAIELRKNLEELLGKCRMAVSALDRIDGGGLAPGGVE